LPNEDDRNYLVARWENELNAAIRAAKAAGVEAMKHFGPEIAVTLKSDGSPVSEVYKACEQVIVECLSKAFPEYGFLGEEMGRHGPADAPFWIVDPIDGTVQYISGNPPWRSTWLWKWPGGVFWA